MSFSVGPILLRWQESSGSVSQPDGWELQIIDSVPLPRGPSGAAWFNDGDWSGVETPDWFAWVSNHRRLARVWGATDAIARKAPVSVVVPAVLRREGFLDGHGAVIAPDPGRPNDAVFVTGLSGSGKSSLTVSCALGGALFLSDDAVAIGFVDSGISAWPRRSSISLSPLMREKLVPHATGRLADGKFSFEAQAALPGSCVDSLRVRAVIFLERSPSEETKHQRITASDAYRRLLMGHPILAVDKGAKPSFAVVRSLADLPCYEMQGGVDLLESSRACRALAALLPPR